MVFFLPSEVARLVLGYLKENNFTKTYSSLLKECPHLREYFQLLKVGTELETSVLGFSLILILEEWGSHRQHGHTTSPTFNPKGGNINKRRRVSPNSSRAQKKNLTNQTSRSPRKQVKKTIVLDDSQDDTQDSLIESDDDGDLNIPDFGNNGHDEGISSEESSSVSRLQSESHQMPINSCSKKQTSSTLKQNRSPFKVNSSPRKQHHVQFSESLPHLALLKSDTPGKSGVRTGDKDKYPNLVNLLQFNSASDSSLKTSSLTLESQNGEVNSTLPASGETQSVDTGQTTALTPGKKSPRLGNSPSKRFESRASVIPAQKTPSKSSKSPQKVNSFVTPLKLLLSDSTSLFIKSPRRKKPKTPRKRNGDNISPTSSLKEASGNEDRLPVTLFQQVLSDKRLHEKLAETCNFVSGQLKLSISGSSNNGDKEREVTPPRAHNHEELEAVTASKSLEEILDMDTNYANEFLSENIDMTDPAFDCLFKLFGTDKESFSESIRKENQNAETETEKLTKDLEELERSIHEEFGTSSNDAVILHGQQSKSRVTALSIIQSEYAQQESVDSKDCQTGSQDLFRTPVIVDTSFSQPSSPYISQTVYQSPCLSGDSVGHCVSGNGGVQFTPLLRGHELGSSPAHSTPSHKSTYSNSQFIGSPSSVATQPFSPCYPSSPASSIMSPRSQVIMESPGTPVARNFTTETPFTQKDHQDSPSSSNRHVEDEQLQQTPSHRNHLDIPTNQSTPLNSNHQLPTNCSPLVKADLLSGSPVMAQKNGLYTPQARKRIFTPVNSSQLFLSPQMFPMSQNSISEISAPKENNNVQTDQSELSTAVPQPVIIADKDPYDNDTTLTNPDSETNQVNFKTQDALPNSVIVNPLVSSDLNSMVTLDSNDLPRLHSYFDNSGTSYIGKHIGFDSSQCSTIDNTIGCISLPQVNEKDLSSKQSEEIQILTKKKRSTRSDKGKKRKKTSGNENLPECENGIKAVPVLKGLLSKQSGNPKLTLNVQESPTLTAQDFDNQELVMLSPGGSSTLKIPILSCVDAMSSPGNKIDGGLNSVAESEHESLSILPENQVTSALLQSIVSGNSSEIIKQARTIADENSDEKKKVTGKKQRKKEPKESKKDSSQTKSQLVCGNLHFEPGEMLSATPVQFDMKKVHVRMLDFEQQFRKIQPKPAALSNNNSNQGTVILLKPLMPTCDVNIQTKSVTMPTNSVSLATTSISYNSTIAQSTNCVTSLSSIVSIMDNNVTKTVSLPANVDNGSIQNISAKPKLDMLKGSSLTESKPKLKTNCDSDINTGKNGNLKSKVVDEKSSNDKISPKPVDLEDGKDKRCTRSSKPATMERLNDKGISEKVKTEIQSSKSLSAPMGNKIHRKKPKSGKDMRVIMKHLRSIEDEDDVFSSFSENSMDSLASIKSPIYVQSEPESQASESKYDEHNISEQSVNVDTTLENVAHVNNTKVLSPESLSVNKSKNKQKVKMSKRSKNSVIEMKQKEPSKSSQKGIDQSDSSEDNVPLSKLKHKLNETKNDKDEGVALIETDTCNKKVENTEKLNADKTKTLSRESTPTKCPVSPRMTSPTELLTPSKQSWMERVGLTPTKMMKLNEMMSPDRPNPLDVLAVCQNSPLSNRKRFHSPNTRNRFSSPFKSPSAVRRRTPAKKLFDTEREAKCNNVRKTKMHTVEKVDAIIKTLQTNNPNSNLVQKLKSSNAEVIETEANIEKDSRVTVIDKNSVDDKKLNKDRKESKKNKKSKKSEKKEASFKEKHIQKDKHNQKTLEKDKSVKYFLKEGSNAQASASEELEHQSITHVQHEQLSDTENTMENTQHKQVVVRLDETTQETSAATDFLMKELAPDINEFEDNPKISSSRANEISTKLNRLNPVTIDETISQKNKLHVESENISHTDEETTLIQADIVNGNQTNGILSDSTGHVLEHCKELSKASELNNVSRERTARLTCETEDMNNDGVRENYIGQNVIQGSVKENNTGQNNNQGSVKQKQNELSVQRDDSLREVDTCTDLAKQNELSSTMADIFVESSVSGSQHHHRHNSSKKKKKKSKKRHRDESLDGESEERHKKKRKKHEKSKEKHHKKHRKSSELSSLNVDAALSHLYTASNDVPAESPCRTQHISGHASPLSHSRGQPLQQSTPLINNNLSKHGAFGTLFSPVTETTKSK